MCLFDVRPVRAMPQLHERLTPREEVRAPRRRPAENLDPASSLFRLFPEGCLLYHSWHTPPGSFRRATATLQWATGLTYREERGGCRRGVIGSSRCRPHRKRSDVHMVTTTVLHTQGHDRIGAAPNHFRGGGL